MSCVFNLILSLFTVGVIFVNAENEPSPIHDIQHANETTQKEMLAICSTIVKRLKKDEDKKSSFEKRINIYNELVHPCIEIASVLTDNRKIPNGVDLTETLLKQNPVFVNFFLAHIAELCIRSDNCIHWLLQHLLYGTQNDNSDLQNVEK